MESCDGVYNQEIASMSPDPYLVRCGVWELRLPYIAYMILTPSKMETFQHCHQTISPSLQMNLVVQLITKLTYK